MSEEKKYKIRLATGEEKEVDQATYERVKANHSKKKSEPINKYQLEVSKRERAKAGAALKTAGKFAYQLPIGVGAGVAQAVGEAGRSVGNLPLEAYNLGAGTDYHIPSFDLKQYLEPGVGTNIGFGAGELGGNLYGGTRAFQLANQLIGPRRTAAGKIAKHMALGPGLGFALGETQDNNRLPGLIAGLLGPLSQAGKVTNKGVGRSVLGREANQRELSRGEYRDLFRRTREAGIENTPYEITPQQIELLEQGAPHDVMDAIRRYRAQPTLENEQQLQSELISFNHRRRNIEGLHPQKEQLLILLEKLDLKSEKDFKTLFGKGAEKTCTKHCFEPMLIMKEISAHMRAMSQ